MPTSMQLFLGTLVLLFVVGLLSAIHRHRKRTEHGRDRPSGSPPPDDGPDLGG